MFDVSVIGRRRRDGFKSKMRRYAIVDMASIDGSSKAEVIV